MTAYYNEIDPFAAAWLRNLIEAGLIALGVVDERSIEDVAPSDLAGFTQCHFFAGIGVWSHSLRRAGWPDDRPVWTGSCPCQPFSSAGKGGGVADERHLWPAWGHLIAVCKPSVVFGEQVASKAGLSWLDTVLSDLEDQNYTCGAIDLCAAGVGAPHIRQRFFFVADANGRYTGAEGIQRGRQHAQRDSGAEQPEQQAPCGNNARRRRELGDTDDTRLEGLSGNGNGSSESGRQLSQPDGSDRLATSFWSDADWIACRDGKARPVEPGTFPLAHGAAARVGRLRAYGNAIVAPAAEAVVRSFMECRP